MCMCKGILFGWINVYIEFWSNTNALQWHGSSFGLILFLGSWSNFPFEQIYFWLWLVCPHQIPLSTTAAFQLTLLAPPHPLGHTSHIRQINLWPLSIFVFFRDLQFAILANKVMTSLCVQIWLFAILQFAILVVFSRYLLDQFHALSLLLLLASQLLLLLYLIHYIIYYINYYLIYYIDKLTSWQHCIWNI